jgi:hypothetical protein
MLNKGFPRIREREILRVAGELGGSDAAAAANAARHEVLKWAETQIGATVSADASQVDAFELFRGGRTCIATGLVDAQRTLWALRVDRPDANVAARTWTTEVTLGYAAGNGRALFSLRLLVGSPEDELLIEPAVPAVVRQVAAACGLLQAGEPMASAPWEVASEQDVAALVEQLLAPSRNVTYLVCTVPDGETAPLINAPLLAKVMLGLARVVIVPAAHTRLLTREFGKALSVYNGAVRAYLPGFSLDANPMAHRLFLINWKPAEDRARAASTALRWIAANESIRRLQLGSDVLAFSDVRQASLDHERERLRQTGGADKDQLAAAQAQIAALKDDLRRAADTQQWLSDEHKAAEERAQTIEQQLHGAHYRIQHLTDLIRVRGDEPDTDEQLPTTWAEFADWCDRVLSGRVALEAPARREVRSAQFEDPPAAARCLLWLAGEYRDSRINGGSGDLRKAVDDGVHNDRCGADSFDYTGSDGRVTVEWHLKNGGNTRDPHRCLRIYYYWDDASQMVMVVSMPAHRRSGAT